MKHISDIKKMERCDKMLWLSKHEPQHFQPFIYYNEDINALTRKRLNITHWFEGKTGDENDVFFQQEKEYDFFFHTRFEYHDLRIRIPLMEKRKSGYRIYFTYAACYPKESDAQLIADHIWVLQQLNISIEKVRLIHLNSEYIRKEQLDVEELLIINDFFYNEKNHRAEKVMTLIEKKIRDLDPLLKQVDEILSQEEMIKKRTNICTRKHKCPYFERCFHTPNKDTSILNLVSSSRKFALLEEGISDMKDVDMEQIEGTRHQYAQLYAAKTGTMFFDHGAVRNCLVANVKYPISYLDFEWETYAYPPYPEMKPFDVLTFQYSLHIETNHGAELIHKEYLGMQDCRKAFIEHLLNDIPKEGSVICYNVEGAEKLRLKQLAKQFPEYEAALKSIWERMIDLSIPFANGLIYDNRMAGMYSLKKLVAIFTDYDYADLDISHGMEAVRNYRLLDEESASAKQETLQELLAYCAMDTYAMVLIYHWILQQLSQ